MRARDVVRVLGELEDVERLPREPRRRLRLAALRVQAGLRPVEPREHDRVAEVPRDRERLPDQLLRLREAAVVDVRVREQHREAERLDRVGAPVGVRAAALEEGDRRLELADHRVRAPERVGRLRMGELVEAVVRHGLLEELDRASRVAVPEGELSEPREGFRALGRSAGVVQGLLEEPLGALHVVEPERDLCLDERSAAHGLDSLDARREVVLGHAETPAELAEELQRRNPVAGLDPRDVRGRAAREGEAALAEAYALARFLQPPSDGGGIIDVL